jgi:hypothetical protein
MKQLAKIAAYLLIACGLLVLIALPGNRYGWVQEMDPSMSPLPVDASPGGGDLFALLLLVVILASQLAIVLLANHHREKALSLVLMLLSVAIGSSRFWR